MWLKSIIKLPIEWLMRRLVRLADSITVRQLSTDAIKSPYLDADNITVQQLRAQQLSADVIKSPHLDADNITVQQLRAQQLSADVIKSPHLDVMEARIQELVTQVSDLNNLVHYLQMPDSEGYQRPIQQASTRYFSSKATRFFDYSIERPLRILHIGNIANNAYHSAKILNEAGFDCDVLCYNYYHIMGSPEWEDTDFVGRIDHDFNPNWNTVDLKGFQRPRWFAQGDITTCLNYLYARRKHQTERAALFWHKLTLQTPLESSDDSLMSSALSAREPFDLHIENLIKTFANSFPDRPDQLQLADFDELGFYLPHLNLMKTLLLEYDIVQAYSTDPIWPLLVGQRPYIAFEHGTIRSIPFENTPIGRLTTLAYHQANAVIVTNCDNKRAAERLKLKDYRFIPHPVNEKWIRKGMGSRLKEQLREELNADFLLFHPARHHWEVLRQPSWEKGNDIFIKGMASFIHKVAPRAAAIFVDWGQKVQESKELIAQLGIADRVKWIPVQHNCNMARYIDACDLVADQFFLGAFGNIMPKALAMGTPSILYVDEEIHRWCFSKMPPIINVRTPDEVYEGLTKAYQNPSWLQELAEQGLRWYQDYHSNAFILEKFMTLYQDVLKDYVRKNL
jgi:glycosyltransferase involved in cell wall biosynthesis